MGDRSAYIFPELIQNIEEIVTGKPIDANEELLVDVVRYLDQIENIDRFIRVNGHPNREKAKQVKHKIKSLIFWCDVLEEQVELLKVETERAVMQTLNVLKHEGFYPKYKSYYDIPIWDLSQMTAKDKKKHEYLRKKIKEGKLWTTKESNKTPKQ